MLSLLPMWAFWLIIAGICFLIEIFTITFLMFWPGLAAVIAMILALLNVPTTAQVIVFAVLSILLLIFTKPLTKKLFKSSNVETNANSIIGKKGIVQADINNYDTTGKVKVEGELWTAITDDSEIIKAGEQITVLSIDGVKLKVKKI